MKRRVRVKAHYRMTGKTNRAKDRKLHAKKPGWRTAKRSKRRYYEARANRSDRGSWL